jgi:spore coat protein U-like protein
MNLSKQISILALALASAFAASSAMAAEAQSTMTVSAQLVTACEVTATSAIDFGPITALLSTGDQTANSGSTFQVACSQDAVPTIYASGARVMSNGTDSLPFNLSLVSGAAANDLPSTSGSAAALTVTQDGDFHDVTLYARTLAANFAALTSGSYTTNVTVAVVY